MRNVFFLNTLKCRKLKNRIHQIKMTWGTYRGDT